MKTVSSVENITPHKASLWLKDAYEKHRKIYRSRVEFYASEMDRGAFRPTNTIAFAVMNGRQELINGQHTLTAITRSGVTLKGNPITKYFVDGRDEIDDLYAHYDNGKTRNYMDSLRAYGIDEMTGLGFSDLEKLTSALVYLKQGWPARSARALSPHDMLIEMLLEWVGEWEAYREIISPCETFVRNRLLSKPCASIALPTIRHQLSYAEGFWKDVAQINKLDRNDPRMALHKALISWDYRSTSSPQGQLPGTFCRAAAYAWRKWYRNQPLTTIKPHVVGDKKPFHIEGTPYGMTE